MENMNTINNEDKDIIKRAYEYRKNGYSLKDASLGYLVGGFLSPVIAILVILVVISFFSAISGIDYDTLLKTRPFDIIILLGAEIGFIAYFLYTLFFSKRKKRFKSRLGFSFKKFDWLICVVVIILAIAMSVLTAQFISVINHALASIGYVRESSLPFAIDSVGNMLLGLVVMALIPAICEEFLFRGVVLGGMLSVAKTNKAKIICVVLSALLFALVHQTALQLIYPFIMGLVFGFIYLYTNNLLYGMILHFVGNGFVVVANYYNYVKGFTAVEVTYNLSYVLGALALLIIALALAFGAILLIKFIMKNKSPFLVEEKKIDEVEVEEINNSLDENQVAQYSQNKNVEKIIKDKDEKMGKIIMLVGLLFGVFMLVVDLLTSMV